jgi:hypothetical protein
MKRNAFRVLSAVLLAMVPMATPVLAQDGDEKPGLSGEITPMVRYIAVRGDDEKFREDWWMQDVWTGGVEQFTVRDVLKKDISFYAEGRAILDQGDYNLLMRMEKKDLWLIRAGYKQYRKYFDGTGGFHPFSVPVFELDKDLHLDIGNLFFEAGLNQPGWPKIVLGYEHSLKNGDKSLLEWGSVTEDSVTKKIFPSYKEIDEKLDVFKAEIDHDLGRLHVGDQFRFEHYTTNTTRHDAGSLNLDTNTSQSVAVLDDYSHNAFYNTFHTDSHVNEKLYLSLGYFFTSLDGDAALRLSTIPFGPAARDKDWFTRSVDVSEQAHIVNMNAMLGPFKDLTFYGGLQGETLDTKGDTDAVLTETQSGGAVASPNALIVSDKDKWGLEETFGIRYVGIRRTTVYAEGKWTQEDIDLFERELEDGQIDLLRDTDTRVNRQRYSIGFNTSPIPRVTLSGRYRRSLYSNDYNHRQDNTPDGYPAFIIGQDFTIDEASVKLSFRPASWVQTSLQYQLLSMDTDTSTLTEPPSTVRAGNYDANIYNLSITLTPLSRLYLTGLLSYQDASSHAFTNNSPSVLTYDGDVFTGIGSAGCAIDEKTNIAVQYLYSFSDNFKDNSLYGLPLGINNKRHGLLATLSRRINKNIVVKLYYGFYHYDEGSNGGVDDYDAHLVSLSCSFRF